jgi:hypothetical protein
VDQDSGAIDDRLEFGASQVVERSPDAQDRISVSDAPFFFPQSFEFPAYDCHYSRTGQVGGAQLPENSIHRRDVAERRTIHLGERWKRRSMLSQKSDSSGWGGMIEGYRRDDR